MLLADIGEDALTRPDPAPVERAVGIPAEGVAGQAIGVRWVGGVHLDARVHNGHDLESLLAQVGQQAGGIGKRRGSHVKSR